LTGAFRSYGFAAITELFVVIGTAYAFGQVARHIGPIGFAEYQIARATLTSAQPALLIGLGVGLPRFVARSVGRYGAAGVGYLRSAAIAGAVVIALIAPAALIFREEFALVVFGDPRFGHDVVGLVAVAVGLIADGIAYGYLRGVHRAAAANLVRAVTCAIAPALGVFFCRTVLSILVVMGVVTTVFALFMLILFRVREHIVVNPESGRELILYCIRRVPGDICSALLLTIPTICATHLVGVIQAGFIGFGTSAIAVVLASLSPIGYVLLPYLSREIGAGRRNGAYEATRWLPIGCGALATVAVLILWMIMPFLVRVYLGPDFSSAAGPARLMVISAVPLAVYYGGRSIIDAYYNSSRNSIHLVVAALIQAILLIGGQAIVSGMTAIAVSTFLSCTTLAALTVWAQRAIGHQLAT
jgi:O-antigen/teichoic acid export membrane protein